MLDSCMEERGGATRGTGGELTSGPIGQTEREAKVGEEWSSFICPYFPKRSSMQSF